MKKINFRNIKLLLFRNKILRSNYKKAIIIEFLFPICLSIIVGK